jgi:hypothetical protein
LAVNGTNQIILAGYDFNILEPGSQNNDFRVESDIIIDWSESNPFAEVTP